MTTKAYPKYKQTDVEWLRTIPVHWELLPTKRFFELVAEPAPKDNDYELLSIYTDIGVRPRKELEERGNRASTTDGYWMVKKGDLIVNKLLAWMGAIGMSEYDGVTSPAYDILRQRKPLDPKFYHYLFRCGICFTEFRKYSRGIMDMRLRLYFDQLGQLPMPFPPLDEQMAVSSFLDAETSKIDGLVSEQRRLIELLKEKRQAVISHAVTKGLNLNAPMKPSGIQWLGDVPQHWRVQRVKHAITSIEQGWSPQCENDPVQSDDQWGVLKVGCVNYGKFTAEENKALPANLEPQPGLGIQKDDLLISRANTIELVGSAAVAERDHRNLMLCDKLYRLRMDHSRVLPEFLCYFLTCEAAREPIELGATGASPSMKNIAQSVILELWFATPDTVEQRDIIDYIRTQWNAITRLIAEADRAIELLQERRTSLISAAVTGKIDVRAFASKEAVA